MDTSRLYALREDNDITQIELGEAFGCTKHAISKWEKGIAVIPLRKLNMYANYFNVSMDYLLKLSNAKTSSTNIVELDKVLIGKRLRSIRKHYQLSLSNFADMLNTTESTIWAYEKGKTLILTAFAYQLCKEFNISMDYLCGRLDRNRAITKIK